MELLNLNEPESSTIYQKAFRENKNIVYFGIIIYFIVFFSVFLFQVQKFYSEFLPSNFFSIYVSYFRPSVECSIEYDPSKLINEVCINSIYIIGLIPTISVTAFITAFLSREKAIGELTSIFSLILLMFSLIIVSILDIALYSVVGDSHGRYNSSELFFGILFISIIPLLILHLSLGWLFGFLGSKSRYLANKFQ